MGQIFNPGIFSESREQELSFGTKVCRIIRIIDREISCLKKRPVLRLTTLSASRHSIVVFYIKSSVLSQLAFTVKINFTSILFVFISHVMMLLRVSPLLLVLTREARGQAIDNGHLSCSDTSCHVICDYGYIPSGAHNIPVAESEGEDTDQMFCEEIIIRIIRGQVCLPGGGGGRGIQQRLGTQRGVSLLH